MSLHWVPLHVKNYKESLRCISFHLLFVLSKKDCQNATQKSSYRRTRAFGNLQGQYSENKRQTITPTTCSDQAQRTSRKAKLQTTETVQCTATRTPATIALASVGPQISRGRLHPRFQRGWALGNYNCNPTCALLSEQHQHGSSIIDLCLHQASCAGLNLGLAASSDFVGHHWGASHCKACNSESSGVLDRWFHGSLPCARLYMVRSDSCEERRHSVSRALVKH